MGTQNMIFGYSAWRKVEQGFFLFFAKYLPPMAKVWQKMKTCLQPISPRYLRYPKHGIREPSKYFFYKCNLRLQQLTRCEGIFFLHIFGQKVKNYLFSSLIFGRGNLSFGLFFISKTSGKRCKSNFRITNL